MFIAVILYCSSAIDVKSCDLIMNTGHLYQTMSECEVEALAVTQTLVQQGLLARPYCIQEKFGEPV